MKQRNYKIKFIIKKENNLKKIIEVIKLLQFPITNPNPPDNTEKIDVRIIDSEVNEDSSGDSCGTVQPIRKHQLLQDLLWFVEGEIQILHIAAFVVACQLAFVAVSAAAQLLCWLVEPAVGGLVSVVGVCGWGM